MADKLDHIMQRIRSLAAAESAGQHSDRQLLQRFRADRDEAVFVALVQRHGAMVLNVCRRVLHNVSDAEDACQATFLVLARKAHAIRKQESLGCWLHGVALRAATSLLRQIKRRRMHEMHAAQDQNIEPVKPAADVTWREVRAILDQEIQRLPAKLKDPIVLCYVQDKPHNQGALELGVNLTTFRGRLERARNLLQKKLTLRGVTLSGALLATVVFERSAAAALPPILAVTTVKAAVATFAGESAAGLISTQVANLAEGVIQSMFLAKLKLAGAMLLTLSIVVLTTGVFSYRAMSGEQTAPKQTLNQRAEEAKSPVKADEPRKQIVVKKDDKDLILGTWALVRLEVNGKAQSSAKGDTWVIAKDKIRWSARIRPVELTYSLDATKAPKTVDMQISQGRGIGAKHTGIYALDGDTLQVCYRINDEENRPQAFQSKEGVLLVFNRMQAEELPPKKEDVLEKDLKQLEGPWEMLSMEVDGKTELLPKNSKVILTHKGKTWTGTMNGTKVEEGTFAIDATQNPKTKDRTVTLGALKGKTIPEIYELHGDELRVCMLNNPEKDPDKGRPVEFTSKPGSGFIIINFRRASNKPPEGAPPPEDAIPMAGDAPAQKRPDKAPPNKEFVRDYLRVEVRGTLAVADGIICIDVRPFVFGGSTTWKLVIESQHVVKTAKELNGKRVTLKGELQLLDGKVGKDGKRLPRERVGFAELPGELAIVVSELRPADPQND